ncbi:OLC1v1028182C1 [Oldenlandia corymbosa var. corymbosa]|uniref:OLC1v1028182C1 n=1 Tax=Oldenlandia corymbosa var. corymbosa TaxID=529605 RepID=A0AAV1CBX2_OLDCO|nr:OLC1v1028182C1 [Oldenlandia corymbosa var. corymbosa]
MECAGKGSRGRCSGPPTRLCSRCEAVAYCSISHQISHWTVHKDECERLEQQMKLADTLKDFPFTFSQEVVLQYPEKRDSRCSFLSKRGVHQLGMWLSECSCGASTSSLSCSRVIDSWDLSSTSCPCRGSSSPLLKQIASWKDYYEWRSIPFHSPVALLLHWPLTVYWAHQLAYSRSLVNRVGHKLCIHYLGPEKELHQLAAFGELYALFPGVDVHICFVGPEIPQERDGECIDLFSYAKCTQTDCECKSSGDCTLQSLNRSSKVTIQLHAGYYHDVHTDLFKQSSPDLIVAPNAGVAAYRSWLPTIELLKEMQVPAVFSDFCEEASCLAVNCINSITGSSPAIPIQLNPFRHPLPIKDSALLLPCYSNCFMFGM